MSKSATSQSSAAPSTPSADQSSQPTAAYSDLNGPAPSGPQTDPKELKKAIKARWPEVDEIGEPGQNAIIKALVTKGVPQIEAVRQVNSFAGQHNWTAPSPDPAIDDVEGVEALGSKAEKSAKR